MDLNVFNNMVKSATALKYHESKEKEAENKKKKKEQQLQF